MTSRAARGHGCRPTGYGADGLTVGADRHRRRPLTSDRDRVQLIAVGAGSFDSLARRLDTASSTTPGVLGGGTVESY